MKILFLAPKVNLDKPCGGTLHYLDLTECMARRFPKLKIVLIASGSNWTKKEKNLEKMALEGINTSTFKHKKSDPAIDKLNDLIQDVNPDFIYYRTEPFELFPQVIRSGKPKLIEIGYNLFAKPYDIPKHISLLWSFRNRYLEKWLKLAVKPFDAILVQSESSRRSLEKRVKDKKIVVVRDAANTRKFRPSRKQNRKTKIIFVGNELKYQGVHLLVGASKELSRKRNDFEISIIGDYSKGRFPGAVNVNFMGFLPNEEVVKVLCESDIGVAPYLEAPNEPYGFSPIKIFEYMAAGLAIVATDTEWNREIIEDGKTGLLFKKKAGMDLAGKLEHILGNPELLAGLKAASRRHSKNHDWSSRAEEIVNIFKNLGREV